MKSLVGLKDFVIAELLTDTEEGTTYGEVQSIKGVMDVSVTPSSTDADLQYADDNEYDVIYGDPEITIAAEFAQLPLAIQVKLGGHRFDDDGVMVRKAGDTPPYVAIGFKAEKREGGYRFKWLLKCRSKPITETFHTKEGQTVTRQTGKIEFTAIKRASDGEYEYTADEGENGFTKEKAAAFLAAVHTTKYENAANA